jgi:hypothetical protein
MLFTFCAKQTPPHAHADIINIFAQVHGKLSFGGVYCKINEKKDFKEAVWFEKKREQKNALVSVVYRIKTNCDE